MKRASLPRLHRRTLISLLGAAALPMAARGQQPTMPVIGYLNLGTPEGSASLIAALRKGLGEMGYSEGRNLAIDQRFAYNDQERLSELVADLVRRRVSVIVAVPAPAARVAKAATATIPIVFYSGGDPVQLGLIASLNRPGGNLTGVTSMNVELAGKRLGLLHELMPPTARLGVLLNPHNPNAATSTADAQTAATGIGRQIEILVAGNTREIDAIFASLGQRRIDALMVASDTLFNNRVVQVVTAATHYRVPTIYSGRDYAEIGGLMSYGTSLSDLHRQAGVYAGRILKGDKPQDLPVVQPAKFEFVVNLQTARTVGIEVPPTLLARADEVIE